MEIKIKDLSELNDFANKFAKSLKAGDTICLDGELGSGKTQFVRFVGVALGVKCDISSPTFCFMNEYKTSSNLNLYHFDLYRLDDESQLSEIGFDEFGFSPSGGVSFIEWSKKFGDDMPEDAIHLQFFGHGSQERRILIDGINWQVNR